MIMHYLTMPITWASSGYPSCGAISKLWILSAPEKGYCVPINEFSVEQNLPLIQV